MAAVASIAAMMPRKTDGDLEQPTHRCRSHEDRNPAPLLFDNFGIAGSRPTRDDELETDLFRFRCEARRACEHAHQTADASCDPLPVYTTRGRAAARNPSRGSTRRPDADSYGWRCRPRPGHLFAASRSKSVRRYWGRLSVRSRNYPASPPRPAAPVPCCASRHST